MVPKTATSIFVLLSAAAATAQVVPQIGPNASPLALPASCGDGSWLMLSPTNDSLTRWNPTTKATTTVVANSALAGRTLWPTRPTYVNTFLTLACSAKEAYALTFADDVGQQHDSGAITKIAA